MLQPYYKSVTEVLEGKDIVGVVVSAYIFAYSAAAEEVIVPHILLVKRQKNNGSWANKWEVPKSACKDSDITVLYSIYREVFKKVNLHLIKINHKIGDNYYFTTRF